MQYTYDFKMFHVVKTGQLLGFGSNASAIIEFYVGLLCGKQGYLPSCSSLSLPLKKFILDRCRMPYHNVEKQTVTNTAS